MKNAYAKKLFQTKENASRRRCARYGGRGGENEDVQVLRGGNQKETRVCLPLLPTQAGASKGIRQGEGRFAGTTGERKDGGEG